MKRLALILPLIVMIASCGPSKKAAGGAEPNTVFIPKTAIQTVWDIKHLVTDDVTGTGVFLIFTDSSHINGYSGCNIFTASSNWVVNKISFYNIATKRKRVCDSTNVEHKVFSFLPQVDEIKMVNNTLQLYKAGTLIMDFEARLVVDDEPDPTEK